MSKFNSVVAKNIIEDFPYLKDVDSSTGASDDSALSPSLLKCCLHHPRLL